MPNQARFQSPIGAPVIDEAAGVIKGCRIATLGAISTAAKDAGQGLEMDNKAISGLFNLAKENGDKLPAFFTHEWFDSPERDPLHFDAGVWNNFRLDGGNLVADFQSFETPYKAGIFSRAKADPNSIAVSPIFDYDLNDGNAKNCTPTAFISADFVKYGAINKALFKQTTKQNMPITLDELKEILKDPEAKAMIQGCIDGHTDANEAEMEADAAEMEKEAGVEDEDKKKEDEQRPALMRAVLRCNRAITRRSKSLDKTAVLAEVKGELKTIAAAAATEIIGKGGFIKQGDVINHGKEAESYITAQLSSGCKTRAAALARMAKDKPELYHNYQTSRQAVG